MSWCTIESDPGVFTELIAQLGVKNVQMSELWDLEEDTFKKLGQVYGLIFLFKWQREPADSRVVQEADDVFFAKQVVNNACATQAILSILFNRDEIDLGSNMNEFKEFTMGLPPDFRGESIGNSDLIRNVHNSFARAEIFISDEKVAATEDDDVYHFVGYVPVNGYLYELDGLKPGPVRLGACTLENWTNAVRPAIQERIARYSQKEIRFNLLALIRDSRVTLQERLNELKQVQSALQERMQGLESGSSDAKELQQEVKRSEEEIKECQQNLERAEERFAQWKVENIRRKHNYVPFAFHLFQKLAEKGVLSNLVTEAEKVQAEKRKRAEDNKAKNEAAAKK